MESECCFFVDNNQVNCSGDVCGLKEISETTRNYKTEK